MTLSATLQQFSSNAWNKTIASATVASAVGCWVYDRLVTDPLYKFWRKGAWWHNIDDADLCSQITNGRITGYDYASDPALRSRCQHIIESDFESWNATVATTLYFTLLTFIIMQCLCQCCFVRPIVRAITERAPEARG